MGSNAEFHEEMDAFDLVINALMEHEKRLDEISHRLEDLVKRLSKKEAEAVEVEEERAKPSVAETRPTILFHNWTEFKKMCRGAEEIAFEIEENSFRIYSLADGVVFKYVERLPVKRMRILEEQNYFHIDKSSLKDIGFLTLLIDKRLKCGVNFTVDCSKTLVRDGERLIELSYGYKADEIKESLSKELSVSKKRVFEGKITC